MKNILSKHKFLSSGILAVGTAFMMSGCLLIEPYETENITDEVKLIDSRVSDPYDTSTYLQPSYDLDEKRRLLIRAQNLDRDVMVVSDTHKVTLELRSTDSNGFTSVPDLQACPVTKSWMMGATWKLAHVFGGSDARWSTPGADINEVDCAAPVISPTNSAQLIFDVTPWVINYLEGNVENFGLLLKTSEELSIYGEKSGSAAPRLRYFKNEFSDDGIDL